MNNDKCFITEYPVQKKTELIEDEFSKKLYMAYSIKINEKEIWFRFYGMNWSDWENNSVVKSNRHIFIGLILNEKWPISQNTIIDESILDQILLSSNYPKTHKEKLDNLLIHISIQQNFDGDSIKEKDLRESYKKLYFKHVTELIFYLKTLIKSDLIDSTPINGDLQLVNLSFKGLEYIVDLESNGKNSNNCFIAMSFDDDDKEIYINGIQPAIVETGFTPIIVNEAHTNSDQTINDRIIADIKRSRFIIADFTKNKHGVYFEAGYAAGRGLKVIYTCNRKDKKDLHFDTKHYQHIFYDTPEELKQKLIYKIEAWIKD